MVLYSVASMSRLREAIYGVFYVMLEGGSQIAPKSQPICICHPIS
jgi:hypothetical protein